MLHHCVHYDLTLSQIAVLRGIGLGFSDSQWATPIAGGVTDATQLLALRMIQQWDNQYIVTDFGREVLDELAAAGHG